tara:strand:+ start:162 stop:491 length:330 start_codon:yes stop_codon:yes gene_type:complete
MIIKNSIVPKLFSVFINVYAIALYPFVFIRDEGNEVVINHERIHLKQQRELWVIGFYLLYVLFWLINLVRYRDTATAYYELPFEREARVNESDWVYLLNRKRFAWTKYL